MHFLFLYAVRVLYNYFMVSVFGWPDPNTGFDQSEHALYTCYFIKMFPSHNTGSIVTKDSKQEVSDQRYSYGGT